MKFKNALTAGALSVALLSTSPAFVSATNADTSIRINAVEATIGIPEGDARPDVIKHSQFKPVTGKVKEIKEHEFQDGVSMVLIEDKQGQLANLVISKDTYNINNEEITEGTIITGFYDSSLPMIMIYPAQYNVEVVAVANKDINIKVDRFDENLTSYDNELILRISDDTEIMTKDGKAFDGDLANRKLAVIYGIATRSIPAQANPTKIVVLPEKEEIIVSTNETSTKSVAITATADKQDFLLGFLRALSESLGIRVK